MILTCPFTAACPRRSPVSLYSSPSSSSSSSSSETQSTMSRRNYDRITTTTSTTTTTPPPPPPSSTTPQPTLPTTTATRLFFRTARPFGGSGSNFPATPRFNTYSRPAFFSTSSPSSSSSPVPPLFFSSSSSSSSTKHQKPLQFQGVNWPHPGRTLPPPVTSSCTSLNINVTFNQFLILLLFILTPQLIVNSMARK